MFYKCKKCGKEVLGKEILGVISDDESVALTHIKCGGDIERSNYTKHLPISNTVYSGEKMKIVPLELKELNELVYKWHRHHKPVQGHRFSIGVINETGELVGGCSVGRPVARNGGNPKEVLEVTRLVTNGTRNACSMLYSAVARIAKEMGYKKVQTYILETENGASLKASNWICEDDNCGGGQWKHTDGKERKTDQPICKKQRWVKYV